MRCGSWSLAAWSPATASPACAPCCCPRRSASRARHLRALPGGGARRGSCRSDAGRCCATASNRSLDAARSRRAQRRARLLPRYGSCSASCCARERDSPPWRALLPALRRLEARGEVRGGRFVDGFVGEQFALPEAVEALRACAGVAARAARSCSSPPPIRSTWSASSFPARASRRYSGQVIAYRDGVPVEIGELGAVRSRLQMG